ncbi:MAG: PD-(D/E)XK nuclease domain-containing protein [Oligoflexia bacterium]|nr:PD-(D/E)XK nuclease domain-containing protein [Oligoflexia bacterium]
MKEWYNGYNFAGTVVYNPWSIVNFIESNELRPYWVNTSDNVLIRDLVINSNNRFKTEFEKLLLGDSCEHFIDEHVVFGDLQQDPYALWSLLVTTGYLNASSCELIGSRVKCSLQIPNKEIYGVYKNMIEDWLSYDQGIQWYNDFLNHLLSGNTEKFSESLEVLFSQIVSSRDMGAEPETFYHGLLLGLTASLDRNLYEVSSNRESGYGYYDIMIIPKDEIKLGIILELKSIKDLPSNERMASKALARSAKDALIQIDSRDYAAVMRQRGIKGVLKIGIALSGKHFKIATVKSTKLNKNETKNKKIVPSYKKSSKRKKS